MAVSQNICYQVVTIGWLKNFIGTKLQNSNGGTVYVGGSYDDSYCPTYSQLTNGSLLPYRSASSSGPASDTDGITVNPTCHATSQSYSSNQLVNIHDMAVCNTRLDSFTVSVDTSTISGCDGGTRNLSYTRRFTRTTWDMLNCSSQSTPRETSASVNDTRNNLISWDTNGGSIVDSSSAGSGKAVSIGKNTPPSTAGSSYRTLTITGSSTFRGSTSTDTTSVGQNGVGGEYKYYYTTQVGETNYRIECSGGPSFGCGGGSYSAAAKHDYKDRDVYRWQDDCGVNYDSWTTYSDSSTKTATDDTYSGSFPNITSVGGSNYASWGKSGYAGSCSWTQTCDGPSVSWGTGTCTANASCGGGSVPVSATVPGTITYGDGSTASTSSTQSALVTIYECKESTGCTTTGSTTTSEGGTIEYTLTQTGCSEECACSSFSYSTDSISLDSDQHYNYEINYTGCSQLSISTNSTVLSWFHPMSNVTNTGNAYTQRFNVENNPDTSSRTGNLIFSYGGVDCKTISISQDGRSSIGCPNSGDVVLYMSSTIGPEAQDWTGALFFKTGDTKFSSMGSVSCDGVVITGASWGYDTSPGYKFILLQSSENTSYDSRNGSVTVNMINTDNETCTYNITITQRGKEANPKAVMTLSDGTTVSVKCNDSSTLTRNELLSIVTPSRVIAIDVKDCVTKIGDYAFDASEFTNLTSITMSNSVTEIGQSVHHNVTTPTQLRTITFSNNLVSIGDNAFWGCSKLTSINLPNGLRTLGNDVFRDCSGLTSVVLPDSVRSIGDQCFYSCVNLREFTFGVGFTGVTSFGQSLDYTDALTTVTCKATTPPVIDDFMFCSALDRACLDRITIYVPKDSVRAYKDANGWREYKIDKDGI